jgi:bifunctional non-homologous end joining protein LigD
MLRMRSRSLAVFVEPCLPSPANRPPAGSNWIHEIKHDGFRIMARRDSAGVRLLTRNGHDFTERFPLAAAAVTALPSRSFLIDGEAMSQTTAASRHSSSSADHAMGTTPCAPPLT